MTGFVVGNAPALQIFLGEERERELTFTFPVPLSLRNILVHCMVLSARLLVCTALAASGGSAGAPAWAPGLGLFLRAAGWRSVEVVGRSPRQVTVARRLLREVQVNFVVFGQRETSHDNDDPPVLFLLGREDPTDYWDSVACGKPLWCAALVVGANLLEDFTASMRRLPKSRAFYTLVFDGSALSVFRSQTFRDQETFVLNRADVIWDADAPRLRHRYDLQGATVTSMSLSWEPYNRFFDCKEEGWRDCEQDGIVGEVVSLLADMFNFTLRLDVEPHGNWGSDDGFVQDNFTRISAWNSSKDGPAMPNGVMGYIQHDLYDASLVAWRRFLSRGEHMGFTIPIFSTERKIALNLEAPPLDMTMFLRPFTVISWVFISLLIALLAAFFFLSEFLVSFDWKSLVSGKIFLLSVWMMFVLLNSYYGGALTMFLSTAPSLPFSNLEEATEQHPTWMLFIIEHEWTFLKTYKAGGGLKEVIDRIFSAPERYVVANFDEAIDRLIEEPGSYFFPTGARLGSYLAANRDRMSRLDRIITHGTPMREEKQMAFSKHNPNLDMFNRGILRLKQSGTMDVIVSNRTGRVPTGSPDGPADTTVVGIRHAVLIWLVILFAYALALCIFVAEKVWWSKKAGVEAADLQGRTCGTFGQQR